MMNKIELSKFTTGKKTIQNTAGQMRLLKVVLPAKNVPCLFKSLQNIVSMFTYLKLPQFMPLHNNDFHLQSP